MAKKKMSPTHMLIVAAVFVAAVLFVQKQFFHSSAEEVDNYDWKKGGDADYAALWRDDCITQGISQKRCNCLANRLRNIPGYEDVKKFFNSDAYMFYKQDSSEGLICK